MDGVMRSLDRHRHLCVNGVTTHVCVAVETKHDDGDGVQGLDVPVDKIDPCAA